MTSELEIAEATTDDLDRIVELADAKRHEYEGYAPVFWRPSADAVARHRSYLGSLVEAGEAIALVARRGNDAIGFVIARLVGAPPVYDPGGPTCLVDDFTVEADDDWPVAGRLLLDEALRRAAERGAVQAVVNCAFDDVPKRTMLAAADCSIANAVHVKPIRAASAPGAD